MEFTFKGIELRTTLIDFSSEEKEVCIIYYEGKDVSEIFEKLNLIEQINNKLNENN